MTSATNKADPVIYYPTYQITSDLSEETARWLREQQGDGPLALIDVTDVCACCKVSATLRDEHGDLRGEIDADGSYRLT